ncbi:MAG: sigma-70 family RNA polymerase sigma factor [Planctomycetes bacterium]|nr:sigma-70 family RNA polymerase sigma factor [Planctomycetota bacterium]
MNQRRSLTNAQRRLLSDLLRDCGPRVYAYVWKVFGDAVEVEDVVAEVFCRAADNIEALSASDRRDLYLLTIARNLGRDAFRKKRPAVATDDVLESRVSPASQPIDEAADRESQERLLAAVGELPEKLREVVVLRLSTALTFEDIARMLNSPLGTVLSRMHQAVERLREQLGSQAGWVSDEKRRFATD